MKNLFLLALTASSLVSSMAFADTTCTYVLNDEAYWEDASGVLTVGASKYSCKSIVVGEDAEMLTVCKDVKSASRKPLPEYFKFTIVFDGAEANFTVRPGIETVKEVCSGVATVK